MKNKTKKFVGLALVATVATTIAQSRFSGIYGGDVSGNEKFLLAITKGGRALGLSNTSEGFKESFDPSKSTIDDAGKLKAVFGDGTTTVEPVPDFVSSCGTMR